MPELRRLAKAYPPPPEWFDEEMEGPPWQVIGSAIPTSYVVDMATTCKEVELVMVSLRDWDTEFLHRLDVLAKRNNCPVCTFAVREHSDCPRGKVLLFCDPEKFGQVVVLHSRMDWEWTHRRLQSLPGMKLHDIEAIGKNPKL